MSNKQVIAIFIIGVGLLLGAFWAGLYVVKQDSGANANQSRPANQNSHNRQLGQSDPRQQPASANTTPQPPPRSSDARYIVQVGSSFGTVEKANELTAQLRKKVSKRAYAESDPHRHAVSRAHRTVQQSRGCSDRLQTSSRVRDSRV